MPESTLSPHVAPDGVTLAVQDWEAEPGVHLRGVVLIVHGLGEHAGRYDEMAGRLSTWGFGVRGYDHYGHGESAGARGTLTSIGRLEDDLADVLDDTRSRVEPGLPFVLLGHSLGGLVAAHAVANGRVRVDGLVLSSPALDPGLTSFQRLLLAILPRIAPDLGLPNGLDVAALSHDPAVVAAYRADRRVHKRISPRLAQYIAWASGETWAAAARWNVPTLLLYAGSDRLVDPKGSAAFAAAAPRDIVDSQAYPALYHEIFNEVGREAVYARLRAWLDARFPPR